MLHIVLAASAVLVVVLVLALAREVRLRRALQQLLAKFLANWRHADAKEDQSMAVDSADRHDADDRLQSDG